MLSAEANAPSLDVAPYENSERPFPVSAGTGVDATRNFERYITGKEKCPSILSMYGF